MTYDLSAGFPAGRRQNLLSPIQFWPNRPFGEDANLWEAVALRTLVASPSTPSPSPGEKSSASQPAASPGTPRLLPAVTHLT